MSSPKTIRAPMLKRFRMDADDATGQRRAIESEPTWFEMMTAYEGASNSPSTSAVDAVDGSSNDPNRRAADCAVMAHHVGSPRRTHHGSNWGQTGNDDLRRCGKESCVARAPSPILLRCSTEPPSPRDGERASAARCVQCGASVQAVTAR